MRFLMLVSLLLALQMEFSVSYDIKDVQLLSESETSTKLLPTSVPKTRSTKELQPIKKEAYLGKKGTFNDGDLPGDVGFCSVVHDRQYPGFPESSHSRILYSGIDVKTCAFELIDIQPEDVGIWEIRSYTKPGDNNYTINRYNLVIIKPEEPAGPTAESTPSTSSETEPTTKLTPKPTKESTLATTGPTTPAPVSVRRQDVNIGTSMYFKTDYYGTISKCIALHNDKQYEIYPMMNLPKAKYLNYGDCSFDLYYIDWEHVGEWKITGYYSQEQENTRRSSKEQEYSVIYNLTVYKNIKVQPSERVTMNSGYASFYLSKTFENPTSCRIEDSHGNSYELLGNAIDPTEGIELHQICGVRMRYDDKRVGTWKLIQSNGTLQELRAPFTIRRAADNKSPTTKHLFWQRGDSESLQVTHSSFYCDVVKPDGAIIPLTDKSCKYNLDVVSDKHAGVWKGRYAVNHEMKLVEEEHIVEVWNPEAVEISVSTEENRINMLCKTGVDSLNSCIFESPNGTVLSLQGGMGDETYDYYGNGFISERSGELPKKAECGLTIRQPSLHDYGQWRCSMRKENSVTGGLIYIANPRVNALAGDLVSTWPVFVKRGDEFTIKCMTTAPLNYCWMQSPNGTMYSVTKNGSGGNLLRYNGEGLSMGVCGAVVENADDTYNGDWSCRLGVVGAAEVESIVPVTVTESELIPRTKNITIRQGKPIELSCDTLPSSDATIDYCRWVRPNGHGIYRDIVSRYVVEQDNTTCTLKITDVTEDDIGTWMCLARLSTGSDEEVWSKLELRTGTGESTMATSTALHIVGIVLLVTTLFCGAFVIAALYRKKLRRTPPPPPAYDIHYGFPKNPEIKVIPNFNDINHIKNLDESFKQ